MTTSQGVLTSLRELDALRSDVGNAWVREEGSHIDNRVVDGSSSTTSPLAICHLDAFLPFTSASGVPPTKKNYEEGASIALAVQHLNAGDGSISREVQGLNERCNIRFTVEFEDTQYDGGRTVNHVIDVLNRDPATERAPCAFVGAYRSSISIPSSLLTGLQRYPQVSGASTSSDLDNKGQYPYFARTVPSDAGNAVSIIQFLSNVLKIEHLAVININDAYGNNFIQGLRAAAVNYAPMMKIHQASLDNDEASTRAALQSVKETEYRYILALVFGEETFDQLLEAAYDMGIAGTGEHQWFFGDSFNGVDGREFEANSPLHLAYRGVGSLQPTGGVPGLGFENYENFLTKLSELNNPTDLDYLASIFPGREDPSFQQAVDGFQDLFDPPTVDQGTFLYEAVIGLGLAACNAAEGSNTTSDALSLDGQKHYLSLVNTAFQGVNSNVVLDPSTGSKLPNSTMYQVSNVVENPLPSDGDRVIFSTRFTHLYEDGSWNELEPFTFNSGSPEILPDIPPVNLNDEVLSVFIRALALGMFTIILILALGFMWWTNKNRKARVVLASQPFFLHIVCVGTIITGSSIIPFTFDHGNASIDGCTIACNAATWLFTLGFTTTISALFCKTHRVNIILNSSNRMQRIKVTIWDVAKPMIALLSINTLVLSLMSAIAPPAYKLITEDRDNFARPSEIRGQCAFEDAQSFLVTVSLINAAALMFTLYQAFQARNLSTEFAESQFIFRALVAIVMVVFVGGPVLLLARDNANAFVFVASAIIFVSCCVTLLLIFLPKIHFLIESKKKKSRQKVHISGLERSVDLGEETNFRESSIEDLEAYTGVRILTMKTAEELRVEVEELKKLLNAAYKRTDFEENNREPGGAGHRCSSVKSMPPRLSLTNNVKGIDTLSDSQKSATHHVKTVDFAGEMTEITQIEKKSEGSIDSFDTS